MVELVFSLGAFLPLLLPSFPPPSILSLVYPCSQYLFTHLFLPPGWPTVHSFKNDFPYISPPSSCLLLFISSGRLFAAFSFINSFPSFHPSSCHSSVALLLSNYSSIASCFVEMMRRWRGGRERSEVIAALWRMFLCAESLISHHPNRSEGSAESYRC